MRQDIEKELGKTPLRDKEEAEAKALKILLPTYLSILTDSGAGGSEFSQSWNSGRAAIRLAEVSMAQEARRHSRALQDEARGVAEALQAHTMQMWEVWQPMQWGGGDEEQRRFMTSAASLRRPFSDVAELKVTCCATRATEKVPLSTPAQTAKPC